MRTFPAIAFAMPIESTITIECGHVEFLWLCGGQACQRQNSQTQSQYRILRGRRHNSSLEKQFQRQLADARVTGLL